jgi:hypothetical protein
MSIETLRFTGLDASSDFFDHFICKNLSRTVTYVPNAE